MASVTKQWQDGSSDTLTLTYGSAEGSQPVTVTSQPNNSLDRSMVVNIETTKGAPTIQRGISITQIGLRALFRASDGDFNIADNDGKCAVLKQ